MGTCTEFPSLSHIDSSAVEALNGIQRLVLTVVDDLLANNEPIPEPILGRRYSGSFKVRIPPAVHQKLVVEAAEQGISLNRLVSAKLAV